MPAESQSPGSQYEGKRYVIQGFGVRGDARIRNPDGKTVFVSEVPKGLHVGDFVSIVGYQVVPGPADFARYAPLPGQQARTAAAPPVQRPVAAQNPMATPAGRPVTAAAQMVYILHIGPTSKGDDSAIAIVREDVLGMTAYDAVMHLIAHHDDKSVFADSTDRRIAGRLNDVVARAQRERALEELVFTIGNEPVTNATQKKLEDYFITPAQSGKYSVQAVVKQEGQAGAAVPPAAAGAPAQPQKPQVARAVSTVARKGSPGSRLELLV